MQKHKDNVFVNTLGPTFIFKTMDINHQLCPPAYKLSNDPKNTTCLHSTIHINIYIYVGNYVMYDGFVNGVDGIF